MNQITEAGASIALALVGVAIVAIIISRKSNAAGVISALGASFSNALGVAVSPVTGAPVAGLTGIGSMGTFMGGLNGQIGY